MNSSFSITRTSILYDEIAPKLNPLSCFHIMKMQCAISFVTKDTADHASVKCECLNRRILDYIVDHILKPNQYDVKMLLLLLDSV